MKKNLLISVVSIISTVFLIELALQISSMVFPGIVSGIPAEIQDERLGWRPNPEYREHDQNGFRNSFAPDQAAIVAIGDSQTYGTGVSPDQAWPQQLESLANVSVYNMAFGGYGPGHSLILWEEATDLQPELIIEVFYAGNDAFDSFHLAYALEQLPDLRTLESSEIEAMVDAEDTEPLAEKVARLFDPESAKEDAAVGVYELFRKFLADYSKVYYLAFRVKKNYINAYEATISDQLRWEGIRQDAQDHKDYREVFDNGRFRTVFTPSYRLAAVDLGDPRITEGHRISMEAIRQMNENAEASGIEFAVVLLPTKELVFRDIVYNEADFISETYSAAVASEEQFWRESRRFLENQDIHFVDALPALREAILNGNQPYPMSHDGHPNPLGHRVIAELVLSEIVEQESQ